MKIRSFYNPDQPIRLVVSDFDGTMTVPSELSDEAYLTAHATSLASLLKREPDWMIAAYRTAYAKLKDKPDDYGYEYGGQIVAPALADIYMAVGVCAGLVLREFGHSITAWQDTLEAIYREHYARTAKMACFRFEMCHALSEIQTRVPLAVVTSADAELVVRQLNGLEYAERRFLRPLVLGFAQKHVTTEWPSYVPEYVHFSGLQRKVYTRRGHYVQKLHELMDFHAANWCNLLVVSDIAELDLAMPVKMGAYGLLLKGPNTPPYELAWATDHPRVQVIDNLNELLTVLDR